MPLRLLGGLHFLVLADSASWDDPVEQHAEFLRSFVREQTVQTNEVQRSWVLLPCFPARRRSRSRPTSSTSSSSGRAAGLNLVWDGYRYAYAAGRLGPLPVPRSRCGRGAPPVPGTLLRGHAAHLAPRRDRSGADRRRTADGARLLESFVWPVRQRAARAARRGDRRRAARTRRDGRCAATSRELPDVSRRAGGRADARVRDGGARYVSGRDARRSAARRSTRASLPVAFVTAGRPRDGDGVGHAHRALPAGGEREFVGHADFHGAWLEYTL